MPMIQRPNNNNQKINNESNVKSNHEEEDKKEDKEKDKKEDKGKAKKKKKRFSKLKKKAFLVGFIFLVLLIAAIPEIIAKAIEEQFILFFKDPWGYLQEKKR